MPILTAAEAKKLITTPLSDADLQTIIDRVESDIVAKLGAGYDGNAISETVAGDGNNIFLKRQITSISSVTEYLTLDATTGTVLTAGTDYYTWNNEGRLQRLNGKWGARIAISYVPRDDRPAWKRAIIDLTRLELSRQGLKGESVGGEYSYTALDNWEAEQQRIMRRIKLPGF